MGYGGPLNLHWSLLEQTASSMVEQPTLQSLLWSWAYSHCSKIGIFLSLLAQGVLLIFCCDLHHIIEVGMTSNIFLGNPFLFPDSHGRLIEATVRFYSYLILYGIISKLRFAPHPQTSTLWTFWTYTIFASAFPTSFNSSWQIKEYRTSQGSTEYLVTYSGSRVEYV